MPPESTIPESAMPTSDMIGGTDRIFLLCGVLVGTVPPFLHIKVRQVAIYSCLPVLLKPLD